jgi:hypothetical protein
MANEYATLAELKAMRKITDATSDTALQSALTRASRAIDTKTSRRFYLDGSATARTYNPYGRTTSDARGQILLVDDIGSTTGLVVETGTTSGGWTAVTTYETHPDNAITLGRPITGILLASGVWPYGSARVRVTARWGWPAVPDEIVQATLILANRLYLRKDSPEGIAGSSDWGAIRLSRWDPDVEALVGPYVLPGFG